MAAPALIAAIPLLLGVLLGTTMGGEPLHPAVLALLAWLLAAAALARKCGFLAVIAIAAGFCSCGLHLGTAAAVAAAQPALLAWQQQATPDRPVRLTGVLREDASRSAGGVTMNVDLEAVDGVAIAGGVRLSVAGELAADLAGEWRGGRQIGVTAVLRRPLDYRDPGVGSERDRLARGGIFLLGSVKSAALVAPARNGTRASAAAAAVRAAVRAGTERAVGRWSRASAGVVTAILIGDRSGLDAADERRLQAAGTYHVIAISGGNIALLTALLVAAGRAARLPARGTAAVSIVLLAFYGYAAGLAPSVLRATVAGMIFLAARAADHRGAALNAIAVAAAFAAVAAPMTVRDPGFILSFGATFAIILAANRLAPVRRRDSRVPGRWRRWAAAAGRALRLLGAATLCAEIALAPVGASLFKRVSFAGLLLNFAAIPLMSIIQVAGLLAVALAGIWTTPALAAGWVAHVATVALLRSASLVDAAPWLVVDVPPPVWVLSAIWYGGWAGWLVFERPARRIAAVAIALAAGTVGMAGVPALRAVRVPPPPAGWTRVVFLDVGQGDATLLQPPDALPMLVDAGGGAGSGFDMGRRVTLPALWALGVTRLGALVLTHGDPDHIGGAPPLLRALDPRAIWDGIAVPSHVPLQALHDAASGARIPWIERRAGESLMMGRLNIRVLNPPDPDWERRRVRNDDSVVLEARVGGVAFLLPGDITQAVEPAVAAAFTPAPIVIVKAPHHGSAGSSSGSLVDATRPSAVVFSAGARNPFGHPAPVVVDRYRASGAITFSTAEDGAVVMDTDGKTVVVWTWAGRRVLLHPPTVDHKGH